MCQSIHGHDICQVAHSEREVSYVRCPHYSSSFYCETVHVVNCCIRIKKMLLSYMILLLCTVQYTPGGITTYCHLMSACKLMVIFLLCSPTL